MNKAPYMPHPLKYFFTANLLVTSTLFLTFLWLFEGFTFSNLLFGILASLSSAALLSFIIFLLSLLCFWHKSWQLRCMALLFIGVDMALLVDFFIYKLFHFHLNAMVLNILTSPDAKDSIQSGIAPVALFFFFLIALISIEIFFIKKASSLTVAKRYKPLFIFLFFIILGDKLIFGCASLFSYNTLLASAKVVPLYQPLTFTKVAAKYFGFNPESQAQYAMTTKGQLHYPLKPLTLATKNLSFPIYIIAFDAVAYSAITPKTAPNITAFSQHALRLEHHYSGGNSTRFGIFSLIYGLNASYWFSFLAANQKPVLFDVLQQKGYDIGIFSSTNTNWPEFRKTCYVDIQSHIQDHFEGAPWQKDSQNTKCLIKNIQKPKQKPQFNFIFMDAPHGYSFPAKENIFHTSIQAVNYLTLSAHSPQLSVVKKQYLNAIHYDDARFGEIVQALKDKHLYDDALVLFTSDHGQEFFEYGNFGHNTDFSPAQTHVPMMIKLPKSLQHSIDTTHLSHALTAHQDILPTLLTLLGVTSPSKDYSNGSNLFDADYHREYLLCSNWNNSAIITTKTVTLFSNKPNKLFSTEVRNAKSYQLLPDKKTNSKFILDTMNANKKFLK